MGQMMKNLIKIVLEGAKTSGTSLYENSKGLLVQVVLHISQLRVYLEYPDTPCPSSVPSLSEQRQKTSQCIIIRCGSTILHNRIHVAH